MHVTSQLNYATIKRKFTARNKITLSFRFFAVAKVAAKGATASPFVGKSERWNQVANLKLKLFPWYFSQPIAEFFFGKKNTFRTVCKKKICLHKEPHKTLQRGGHFFTHCEDYCMWPIQVSRLKLGRMIGLFTINAPNGEKIGPFGPMARGDRKWPKLAHVLYDEMQIRIILIDVVLKGRETFLSWNRGDGFPVDQIHEWKITSNLL